MLEDPNSLEFCLECGEKLAKVKKSRFPKKYCSSHCKYLRWNRENPRTYRSGKDKDGVESTKGE